MNSVLKYHGGKSQLAKRIIALMPKRDGSFTHYAESHAGGGSVLFELDPEGLSETINDLSGDVSNFWGVIKDKVWFSEFTRVVTCVPFAEDAFSYYTTINSQEQISSGNFVKRAAGFFILNRMSRQGLGKDYATPTRRTRRGMNENVSAWLSAIDGLPEIHERLRRVEIRNMNAIEFIKLYDHSAAVHFSDPPYLSSTRSAGGEYGKFEMTDEDHHELLECLSNIDGRFLLNGYRSAMYDEWCEENGFNRTDIKVKKSSSSSKTKASVTECVWRNFN